MQMISDYVPVWDPQKFNKLASFDSMEIALEEKNRACFHSEIGIPV